MTIQKIYEEHKEDVYRYLCSLCHDQSVAEDLTSDVFLSAISSIFRFRGECSIKTWLFSIARHKWLEQIRREKKQVELEDYFIQHWLERDHDFEVGSQVLRSEFTKKVKELVSLEPETIQILFWKRVEGYSFHEIALELGITENSACVTAHRHKNKLKKQLEQEGFAP
ncbi:MAG: RNA polymerase sigma factor [Eubacteriales bacterium]